jgi:hypothetical protein
MAKQTKVLEIPPWTQLEHEALFDYIKRRPDKSECDVWEEIEFSFNTALYNHDPQWREPSLDETELGAVLSYIDTLLARLREQMPPSHEQPFFFDPTPKEPRFSELKAELLLLESIRKNLDLDLKFLLDLLAEKRARAAKAGK